LCRSWSVGLRAMRGWCKLSMRVSSLFEDYLRFHRIQMANRDVDPVYPVLREIGDLLGWTAEERVRSVFLHVAYYDFGSGLAAFERSRNEHWLFKCAEPKLTCGTERRRHRMGDNLQHHLKSLQTAEAGHGGFLNWLTFRLGDDVKSNWNLVTERLMRINGNGRWAAFKTCEMLAEVCGLPLEAPDMGHANSSGPRQGLALLYPETAKLIGNRSDVIESLNIDSAVLVHDMQGLGADVSLATAETTLCDFHSMVEGRYYCGLDIDVMQEQLFAAPLSDEMRHIAYLAREATLPHEYLGEYEDRWRGADRVRKQVYRKTGEIVERG
jgi:hypothetical protein